MARDIVQIRIDHIGADGLGYGHSEGYRVGVAGVVVNDIVDVEIEHKSPHQRAAWGRVRRVEARGPEFVRPACHHAAPIRGRCGGCPLMHIQLGGQAYIKHHLVEEALKGIRGYQAQPGLRVAPGAVADGHGYRNRSNYIVFRPAGGRIHLGSRQPRGEGFAKMDGCLVNAPVVEEVAQRLTEILNERRIPIFPARSGLRYVTIRANQKGDVLVDLICAQKDPGWMTSVVERLVDHPAVKGISTSVNRHDGNSIRVNPTRHVWGDDFIVENLDGIELRLMADTFFQLNAPVAQDMYRQAAAWVRDAKVIWDLYCGVGGIGLTMARSQPEAKLFGCEFTENAVRLARHNARDNHIDGHYDVADLSKGVPRGWTPPEIVIVNPPRRGLDDRVQDLLRRVRPRQIVYMSCSVESLKRDLELIAGYGYRISNHAAWDMLPQTEHVETLVVMDRMETRPTQERVPREQRERGPRGARSTAPAVPAEVDPAAAHRRRFAKKG